MIFIDKLKGLIKSLYFIVGLIFKTGGFLMKFFKKGLALALLAILIFSLTSCADTTWVYKYKDYTMTSGEYLAYQTNSYQLAFSNVSEQLNPTQSEETSAEEAPAAVTVTKKEVFAATIDDKSAVDWINEETLSSVKKALYINTMASEKGVELSESEISSVTSNANYYWSVYGEAFFLPNGISQESAMKYYTTSALASALFMKLYDEGGEKAVPTADIQEFFYENYARFKFGYASLQDAEGNAIADEEAKVIRDRFDGYLKEVNEKNADIDTFITAEEDLISDTNQSIPEGGVIDRNKIIPKVDSGYNEEMVKQILEAPEKKAVVFEDSNYIFIIEKFNIKERATDFENNRSSALISFKFEDFSKEIDDYVASNDFVVTANDASVKKYNPKNIQDLDQSKVNALM